MCTARILEVFTKENAKKALTEGSIISYSITNAVLYVKDPSELLYSMLMQLMNAINPDHDDVNEPISMGISCSLIGFAAICLALQNYKSYSKIVREYDNPPPVEKPAAVDEELGQASAIAAPLPAEDNEPKPSCGNKFKSYTASLLKTLGASYSWYKLVKGVPVPGSLIVAAVTTGLSVPGNIHSQLALLSSTNSKPVPADPTAYRRM
jgi:hypothetical protein